MEDKWKGSGYDPQKEWDKVTRPRENVVLDGRMKLQVWAIVLGVLAVIVGVITFFLSFVV